jgi:hypothetical protein
MFTFQPYVHEQRLARTGIFLHRKQETVSQFNPYKTFKSKMHLEKKIISKFAVNTINTLRTRDADLRFYITTVQDG